VGAAAEGVWQALHEVGRMLELAAQRTLVKSPPELWRELSDVSVLGQLLGEQFGDIKITRRTPESSLDWQGSDTGGTVQLSPSGWGTRVRLTANLPDWAPPATAAAALTSVLDVVGAARHRPFSRD
jgi:hypothetical protein